MMYVLAKHRQVLQKILRILITIALIFILIEGVLLRLTIYTPVVS